MMSETMTPTYSTPVSPAESLRTLPSTSSKTRTAFSSEKSVSFCLPIDKTSWAPRKSTASSGVSYQSQRYWFEDGSVVVRVANTKYKIYRGILTRQSEFLATVLCPFTSEYNPVNLDVEKAEFEILLSYMFPDDYEKQCAFSFEEWVAIANVADKLRLYSIRAVAMNHVLKDGNALDLIDIGRKQNNHTCYLEGFRLLSMRDASLTLEEGRRLGVDCVVAVAHARDLLAKGSRWSELEPLVLFKVKADVEEQRQVTIGENLPTGKSDVEEPFKLPGISFGRGGYRSRASRGFCRARGGIPTRCGWGI